MARSTPDQKFARALAAARRATKVLREQPMSYDDRYAFAHKAIMAIGRAQDRAYNDGLDDVARRANAARDSIIDAREENARAWVAAREAELAAMPTRQQAWNEKTGWEKELELARLK